MEIQANPNRMVLLQLKKQRQMAIRGHKLLKDKQDELMRRFLILIENYRSMRESVDNLLADGYSKFLGARAIMSRKEIELALLSPKKGLQLKTGEIRIMNIKVPVFELLSQPDSHNYSPISTSASIDTSLEQFAKTLNDLIKLVELEKRIELLAAELERTRRRVNALEYVLIPSLDETIHSISMKLGEYERATLTRLMKIKDIVRGH